MSGVMTRLRRHITNLEGVSRTWFEWNLEDTQMVRTLVVEVGFNTDPECEGFEERLLHEIESATLNAVMNIGIPTTRLKVVPRQEETIGLQQSEAVPAFH